MKNIKILTLCLTFLSISSFFVGCKDEDDPITPANPAITITSPIDGDTAVSGSTINLKFSVTSGNGIKKIVVKYKPANGVETNKFDSTFASSPANYSFSRSYKVGPIGTETYTIVITDIKDNIVTKAVNLKSVTGFGPEDFGSFFHILGTLPGAFDLVAESQRTVTQPDADKDIANTDGAVGFTGAWESKNNTKFVKANTFNPSTGTVEQAITAYDNGTPSTSVSLPLEGDVYIARIRNGNTYAVIKVETKDATNNDCGCANKGKLVFSYKKSL